jgi:coproporphyrinogen III oxidase
MGACAWCGMNEALVRSYSSKQSVFRRYFYIPCRKEHRGTGGVFFDDLDSSPTTGAAVDAEAFTREVGRNIVQSWADIVTTRRSLPFTDAHREWQELRRGRYIEFNLLYDRGVRFGLEGGRIESIMVSAPPRVQWQYMKSVQPDEGSPEHEMLQVLQKPREWVVASPVDV